MILTVGNRTFIGGSFSMVGSAPRHGLAKLSATGFDSADKDWDPFGGSSGRVLTLATNERDDQEGDALLVGGEFTQIGGLARENLAKLELDGTGLAIPDWDPLPDGPVHALAVAAASDAVVIGGGFDEVAGIPRSGLAKLSFTGPAVLDPDWSPNPDGPVRALVIRDEDDDVFVGGRFSSIGGLPRANLAKVVLSGSGEVDSQWNPQADDEVCTFAMGARYLHAGGRFFSLQGLSRTGAARLDTAGDGAPLDWDGGHNGMVRVLFAERNRLYSGGDFTVAGGEERGGLALFPTPRPPAVARAPEDGQFLIARDPEDGPEVTHFRVVDLPERGLLTLFWDAGEGEVVLSNGDQIPATDRGVVLRFEGDVTRPITLATALESMPGASLAERTVILGEELAQTSFRFTRTSIEVEEFDLDEETGLPVLRSVSLPVAKIGDGASTVDYIVRAMTASEGFDTGDFQDIIDRGTVTFGDDEMQNQIRLLLSGDNLVEGDETFEIVLTDADNGAVIGHPSVARITIVENDVEDAGSRLEVVEPDAAAAPLGSVRLILDPPTGQWRLRGSHEWHVSGELVEGLEPGEHTAEFRPLLGYLPPDDRTFPVASGVVYENDGRSIRYEENDATDRGFLLVRMAVPDAEGLSGQWRLVGSGNNQWRGADEELSLGKGVYEIEFKEISPLRNTPPPRTVTIAPDQMNVVDTVYFRVGEALPSPEPLSSADVMASGPFRFMGQVVTEAGVGSGCVTTKHTVLTAAHVLFDDVSFSWRPRVRWHFQRYRGEFEPAPQTARGQVVLSDYAAQREKDRTERGAHLGEGTKHSRPLDAAALYFNAPCGRGGFGGFLSSEGGDDWLGSDADKVLAGYPINPRDPGNWGKPHATPQNRLLRFGAWLDDARVVSSGEVQGFPGNSGGPLFVRARMGEEQRYYPWLLDGGGFRSGRHARTGDSGQERRLRVGREVQHYCRAADGGE